MQLWDTHAWCQDPYRTSSYYAFDPTHTSPPACTQQTWQLCPRPQVELRKRAEDYKDNLEGDCDATESKNKFKLETQEENQVEQDRP